MPLKRFNEDFTLSLPQFSEAALTHATEALITDEAATGKQGLEVKFAAIHEGLTRNNTFYTKDGLTHTEKNDQGQTGGLESWTKPYPVPILRDHESTADSAVGRVFAAEWVERKGSEAGHVEITSLITQPDAIQKFLRGEYTTGSIGMDADHAECSICGCDRMEDWCEHSRGKWYKKGEKGTEAEGKWVAAVPHEKGARRTHIQIGKTWAREYSIVSVPSDARSKAKSMQVLECMLREADGSELSLLEAPVALIETELPPTPPTPPVEEHQPVDRSITELATLFKSALETDVLSFYTMLISRSVDESLTPALTGTELAALITSIEEGNPDLETELAEIKAAVLSSTTLPDSVFALVKVVGEGDQATTLRALPYKTAQGLVDPIALTTALARWNQIAAFTPAEAVKGLKKLRAVALKRGFGAVGEEEKQAEIQAAKDFLSANGVSLEPAQPAELLTKVTTLEAENADLRLLVTERETENLELVEQVTQSQAQVEAAQRTELVNKILVLEEPADSDVRQAELSPEPLEKLTEILTALEQDRPEGTFVMQRLPKQSAAISPPEETAVAQISTEIVLSAFLGGKKASKQVSDAIDPYVKHLRTR